MPRSVSIPLPSRKPEFGITPVAQTTRSASIELPPPSVRWSAPFAASIAVTWAEVSTLTPLFSHQRLIISPPVSSIMRGIMRSAISTTVSWTFRAASACKTMQPMNPAPMSTTREPGFARSAILRASSRVQQPSTPGRSIPGIGGLTVWEPVAINSRS